MDGRVSQDVFELVLARPTADRGVMGGGLVHLWWKAPREGERLVQVYVNGELAEVSVEPGQCQMWLIVEPGRSHRIELVAVEGELVWQEWGEALKGWEPAVKDVVELRLVRAKTLLPRAEVRVLVDGQEAERGKLFSEGEGRGGFGALFGLGGFGFDALTAAGLGEGELGVGPLGEDGRWWRGRIEGLEDGEHSIEVEVVDEKGRVQGRQIMEGVEVEHLAGGAKRVRMKEDWTLEWE